MARANGNPATTINVIALPYSPDVGCGERLDYA